MGSAPGEFHFPIGIAIDEDDVIHVSDYRNSRIQRFDRDGTYLSSFTTAPFPGGIAIDRETHRLYITHFARFSSTDPLGQDRVTYYDIDGIMRGEWGRTGTGPGELNFPGGVAIGPTGSVYVADQQNHRVQQFDRDGAFVREWGSFGPAPGQFGGEGSPVSRTKGPQFVAIDGAGNVYTTEGANGRVQHFTASGELLDHWAHPEDAAGGLGGGAMGITLDAGGRIWVSTTTGRVQQFEVDGTFTQGFGSYGALPSQFQIPHSMAFDSRGDLYVTDALNHRVQKFAVAR
jgi:sugar lactone lactonase YvrE